jgi:hypothetical protein
MPSNPVLRARSAYARSVKDHGLDSAQAQNARRELSLARIEREIERAHVESPPLASEQIQRITDLLTAGGAR